MCRRHRPRELRGEEQRSSGTQRHHRRSRQAQRVSVLRAAPVCRPALEGDARRPAGCSLPALPAVAQPNCERFRMRCLGWLRCAFSEPPLVAGVSRSRHPAVPAWLCFVKALRISLSWQAAEHGFHSEWRGCPSSSGYFAVASCQTEDLPQIVH